MRNALLSVLVVLAALGIWEASVQVGQLPRYILPAPSRVLQTFAQDFRLLVFHAATTAIEVGLGLGFGLAVGVSLALLAFYVRPLGRALAPFFVSSQVVPVFAVAPLLVLWFGFGIWPKTAVAAMIVFFPVAVNFLDGLRSAGPELLEFFQALGARERKLFWIVRAPAALPFLLSGLRVGSVLALVGATVGEWVGSDRGLGYLMLQANARLRLDRVFAAIFLLTLLGLGMFYGVAILERILLPHRRYNRKV